MKSHQWNLIKSGTFLRRPCCFLYHCDTVSFVSPSDLQIIEWLCDNVNTFSSFDQIQEFILGQFQLRNRGTRCPHIPSLLLLQKDASLLLSVLSPLNLVTFAGNLETSCQQTDNIFWYFTAVWIILIDGRAVFPHKISNIQVNISISWHFCDDCSVNLSDQNLFYISPGSLIFFPVGLFASSEPSQGSSIRIPAGGWPLSTFPGSPPGNQRLFQATIQALVWGTGRALVWLQNKCEVEFTPEFFSLKDFNL